MSTPFYDLASLVVVPSGYKSGKIYAQKPLTTDGQLTFTRASTATRVNSSGLIASVASGVPRLDYTNSTCPKLLLEPQRSNITLFSEQLDNANYTLLNFTIAANNTTSPDGTQSAEKLTETTANGEHLLYAIQSIGLGTYTMSAFFKAGGGTIFPVLRFNGSTTNAYAGCVFNTTTGQVVNTFSNTYTGTTTKVDNMGNGWYRVSLTTTTNETTFGVRIGASNTATPTVGDFGSISYAGNTNNFFYAWGVMLEAGAYPTSYIPTTSAAVTRLADTYQKAGFGNTSTAGTLYYEFSNYNSPASANGQYMVILFAGSSVTSTDFSAANRVDVGQGSGNATNYLIFTPQFNAGGTNPAAVTQSGNVTYNPSTTEFRAGIINNTSTAQKTYNVDANLTIDASLTSSMVWSAAFGATRSLIINNLADGREVSIYIRNTNATQRQIIFSGSTSTTGHTPINMAVSAGGVSVTTQNIAGSTGTMFVRIKNINGTFAGGIM